VHKELRRYSQRHLWHGRVRKSNMPHTAVLLHSVVADGTAPASQQRRVTASLHDIDSAAARQPAPWPSRIPQ